MTNDETENVKRIELDTSELLILNGSRETDVLSSEQLLAGRQNGTKVGTKPDAPAGKST